MKTREEILKRIANLEGNIDFCERRAKGRKGTGGPSIAAWALGLEIHALKWVLGEEDKLTEGTE